jgi:hypothetical protein
MTKLFSRTARPSPAPGSGLYSNTIMQSVSGKLSSRARKAGVTPEALQPIIEHTQKALLPLFDGFGLSPHEIGDLLDTSLHLAIEKAAGRLTPELVKAWDASVLEELTAKIRPHGRARARQILEQAGERLLDEKPTAHDALVRAYPLARHPKVARKIADWHLRRTGEDARQPATYIRNQGSSLLSGSSGDVSSTALAALDRRPLGADSDAAA